MNKNTIDVHCDSENGILRDVILGNYEQYNATGSLQPMCQHMLDTWQSGQIPTQDSFKPEYDEFKRRLVENGINIRFPKPGYADEQLFPRDIGFIVGNDFIEGRMRDPQRTKELDAISDIKARFSKVITPPEGVFLEGGDIIMDKGKRIYIGVGQRTNQQGYEFLKERYSGIFTVIPVNTSVTYGVTNAQSNSPDVLHLDCAFMPVGKDHALIYRPGLRKIPKELEEYKFIELTPEEHYELGTNILSLTPDIVIARTCAKRVNSILREIGIKVIEIDFDVAPKTGGSVRCSTLPLYRERI